MSLETVLNSHNRLILENYVAYIKDFAELDIVLVTNIEIGVFEDPEENSQEVVITIEVFATANAAMSFWKRLGRHLGAWLAKQPDATQKLIREQFAIDVHW